MSPEVAIAIIIAYTVIRLCEISAADRKDARPKPPRTPRPPAPKTPDGEGK